MMTIGALLSATSVGAQEMVLQTGDGGVLAMVKQRCERLQSTVRQVHTDDSLLRVNAGQVYNRLSGQLMARLNSRLALNRIDSTAFVEVSGRLDGHRGEFAKKHTAYDIDMTELSNIDCKTRPAEFYAGLVKVRDSRKEVASIMASMNRAVKEYQAAVEQLKSRLAGTATQEQHHAH